MWGDTMDGLFKVLVLYAIKHQCSDIHIDQIQDKLLVSFRKYGRIKKHVLNIKNPYQLIAYICFKANLDVINANNLDTGMILFQEEGYKVSLRVSLIATYDKKSLVIRLIDNRQSIGLNQLCCLKENRLILQDILTLDSGLVIISGKTGSGKTTSLYTLIDTFKTMNKKIVSIENPVEKEISGITQIDLFNSKVKHDKAFEQVLRHDPDVIVYGEIRNATELSYVVGAALSGHLVLTTMHALNSEYVINKLKNLNIDKDDLSAISRYILYQKIFFTKSNQPTIIFEYMNQIQIRASLSNQSIKVKSVNTQAKHYIERGLLYEGK